MTPTQAFNAFKENLPPGVRCFHFNFGPYIIFNFVWISNGKLAKFDRAEVMENITRMEQPQDLFVGYLDELREMVKVHPVS